MTSYYLARATFSAAVLATSLLVSAPVHAQAALVLSFPAQPLATSLHRLAEQSDSQIVFQAALAADKQAPQLQGKYTVDAALEALLAGSGLTFVRSDARTFTLTRASAAAGNDPVSLPTVVVTGMSPAEAAAERFNPSTSVGSKIALTQREIPQTVSVITAEQIQSQHLSNVQEALRYTPGVSTPNVDTSRYRIYSRGFQVDNIQLDGVSAPIAGYMTPANLAMYDRVEVLKGPAGLLDGPGGAGGALNLVRKRPKKEAAVSASVSAGNYSTYRQEIDGGGPLNEAGTLRARGVAALDNHALRQDGTHRSDAQLYGVFEADLSRDTTVAAGGSYQRMHSKSMQYGYPTYTNGSFLNVNPSTYYGPDWNTETYTFTTVFGELEHRLGHGWKTKFSVNYLGTHRESDFGGLRGAVNPANNISSYQTSMSENDSDQVVVDWFGAGPFPLFGRQHMATVGATYLDEYAPQTGAPGVPRNIAVDLLNPTPIPGATFSANVSRQTTRTKQFGLYGSTRLSLADPLTLVLGARVTWWQTSVKADPTANASKVGDSSDRINGHVTPVVGLIYDIDKNHSVYASYTQVFAPQSVRDASSNLIKPLSGTQYETGIKGSYLDGKVNTSLAVFQITQKNRAVADTASNVLTTYFAQGEARSRGVEAQVSGEVMPGWITSAGYTYTNTTYLDNSADTGKNAFSAYTPKHLLKAWTQYRLPGAWHALSVNAGLYVSSSFFSNDGKVIVRQPGYTTVDLGVSYDITRNLSASFNVTNLFDRKYYQSISTSADHNYLGDARMALLTLRAHY